MLLQNLGRKYDDLEQTVISTYASTNLKRPAPSWSSINGPASVTLAEIIGEAVPMPPKIQLLLPKIDLDPVVNGRSCLELSSTAIGGLREQKNDNSSLTEDSSWNTWDKEGQDNAGTQHTDDIICSGNLRIPHCAILSYPISHSNHQMTSPLVWLITGTRCLSDLIYTYLRTYWRSI